MNWSDRKPQGRKPILRVLPREESPPPALPEPPPQRVDRLALFAGGLGAGVIVVGLAIPIQVSRLGGPALWAWGSWLGPYAGVLGLGLGVLSGLTWGMEMDRRAFWVGFGAPLVLGAAWAGGVLMWGGV